MKILKNNINLNFEVNNQKEIKNIWNKFCKNNLDLMNKLFKTNEINLNLNMAIVLVDNRNLPSIEFVIKNCIYKLGLNLKFYLFHVNKNEIFLKKIKKEIEEYTNFVKLIKLDKLNSVNDYNKLLLNKDFWEKIDEEDILIIQEDSIIFNNNIEYFLKNYENYIGALWTFYLLKDLNIGNGGFSLRKKSIMIKSTNNKLLLENKKYLVNYFNIYEPIKSLILKNNNLNYLPEDIYFSLYITQILKENISNERLANEFSIEVYNKYNIDSFGGHNWWLTNIENNFYYNFIFDFFKIFKICSIDYFDDFIIDNNITTIIKYFILKNYVIIIFNNTNTIIIFNLLKNILNEEEIKNIRIVKRDFLLKNLNKIKTDIFISINNSLFPNIFSINKKKELKFCKFSKIELNNENLLEKLNSFYNKMNNDFIKCYIYKYLII